MRRRLGPLRKISPTSHRAGVTLKFAQFHHSIDTELEALGAFGRDPRLQSINAVTLVRCLATRSNEEPGGTVNAGCPNHDRVCGDDSHGAT
jgi:hypothetical protein